MVQDNKEEDDKLNYIIDSLKFYINPKMYVEEKGLDKKEQKEVVHSDKEINKIVEEKGIKNTEFVISNINNSSVFDDEIPIIMEE